MTLANKARGLQKQAIIGSTIASAIGQNLIGIPIARSKSFRNSLSKSVMTGLSGKKSPRSIKSLASDALAGVAAPEVNAAKNQAYQAGEHLRKSFKLDKASKRDHVIARLSAAGDEKGLARIGKSSSPLAAAIRKVKTDTGLHSISKVDQKHASKGISKLPSGSRDPSSTKAALLANAAILPLPGGASTAFVNVAKLAGTTKAAGNTNIMKKINKKFVMDPMKDNAKQGVAGKAYGKARHWAESIGLNPFTSEANRQAHRAGVKSISQR